MHAKFRSLHLPARSSPLTLPPLAEEEDAPHHVPVPYLVADPRRSLDLQPDEPSLPRRPPRSVLRPIHGKSVSFPSTVPTTRWQRRHAMMFAEMPPLEARIAALGDSRTQFRFEAYFPPPGERVDSDSTPEVQLELPSFGRPLESESDGAAMVVVREPQHAATRVVAQSRRFDSDVQVLLAGMALHSRSIDMPRRNTLREAVKMNMSRCDALELDALRQLPVMSLERTSLGELRPAPAEPESGHWENFLRVLKPWFSCQISWNEPELHQQERGTNRTALPPRKLRKSRGPPMIHLTPPPLAYRG